MVAAVLLAAVTLGVFSVLQDYGPESAIRRFHHAVQVGDLNELQRVTKQDLREGSPAKLTAWVSNIIHAGARYRLLRVERQPTEVYAALEYVLPNGESYPTVWIVEKERTAGSSWKVDAKLTYQVLQDNPMGGFR